MIQTGITIAALALLMGSSTPAPTPTPEPQIATVSAPVMLAQRRYSMANRHDASPINEVFVDNMLLTLVYMQGLITPGDSVDWDRIRTPNSYGFVLRPGETFAFHDVVMEDYEDTLAVTTNSHFNAQENFRSSGWLVGDGVCHLASFLNVAARDAGLSVYFPKDHNFASIPQVDRSDGVSIYYAPTNDNLSMNRNLYITNSRPSPVSFLFVYDGQALTITVREIS